MPEAPMIALLMVDSIILAQNCPAASPWSGHLPHLLVQLTDLAERLESIFCCAKKHKQKGNLCWSNHSVAALCIFVGIKHVH